MRVLLTISREWGDWGRAIQIMSEIAGPVTLVHGDAPHGDRDFARIARNLFGWTPEPHPAVWRPHGIYNPQAGLVRNRKMVGLGADLCLALIRNGSRGASHCARLAEEAGIPTRRYTA